LEYSRQKPRPPTVDVVIDSDSNDLKQGFSSGSDANQHNMYHSMGDGAFASHY